MITQEKLAKNIQIKKFNLAKKGIKRRKKTFYLLLQNCLKLKISSIFLYTELYTHIRVHV